jgi:hypothetical protein
MLGIITRIQNYTQTKDKKTGELLPSPLDKCIVSILGISGQTETIFSTPEKVGALGYSNKALSSEDLKELFDQYETIEFTPASKMASF